MAAPAGFRELVVRRRDACVKFKDGKPSRDRREAMDFYNGKNLGAYGDSGDGLSTVVSRDVMEAIESVMPPLLRPFVAGEEVVSFDPVQAEDEEGTKQATEYVNHAFRRGNNVLHVAQTGLKDGLLFRLGVAKTVMEEEDAGGPETFEGLSEQELMALRATAQAEGRELAGDIGQDPLTGLYNRRHFVRVLEQLFAESQRYGHDLSCVMIDLDGYKQLNDGYGHQVGDQLLVMAGKVIAANMRRMDVAARYGGDEFILLLPHAMGDEAAQVADRIRFEYRQASSTLLRAEHGGVTMSIGVASSRQVGAASSEQLLARADAALYKAKEAGRNRVTIADSMSIAETRAATNSATEPHTRSAPAA